MKVQISGNGEEPLLVVDGYTMHVFTAESGGKGYTLTLLAVEMDTSYTSKLLAVYVDGYTLHVHTEGGGKEYMIHPARPIACDGKGYTLHVQTACGGKREAPCH
jgi:hypothetical protein